MHLLEGNAKGDLNLRGDAIHTILNRTPLTADTNRKVIGNKLPNEYLPELIEENGLEQVRGMMESHLISAKALDTLLRKPFTQDDFEEFINQRQRSIQEAIENLLIKERLDLSPQLRELDESVEITELALRECVREVVSQDGKEFPAHILAKVKERIQRAAKKDASFNAEYYEELKGQLEYFDLRELQDTILNKALWPDFEPKLKNKDALIAKFGQLAEMRNGIRHSRNLSDITRKEGEAALLWFKEVINH